MANSIIQIKRSTGNSTPASLSPGELAYSFTANTLYIGNTSNGPVIIGGQVYMQYLASITPGTLTASRAIVVDTNSLINTLFVGNTTSNVTSNSTALLVANATLVSNLAPGSLRLANSTSNVTITVPSSTQANGSHFLNGNGSWTVVAAGVGGANTQLQFNDSGAANGSAALTFDKSTNLLVLGNTTVNATVNSTTFAIANSTSNSKITIPTTVERGGNYYLKADGTWSTVTAGSAAPAGANTQVQFNDSNTTNGDAGLTYNKTTQNFAVGNVSSALVGSFSTSANVGANVSMSTSAVFVGNTTANATHTSGSYAIANATGTATLTPVSLTIGASIVGNTSVNTNVVNAATSANVGANVSLSTTQLFVGNTTVNTTYTSTVLSIVAATTNTTINSSSVFIGNTTANTTIIGGGTVTIANATGTTTITPVSLSTRDVTVTGNLIVNGTTVSLNVATVNVQDSMIRLANGNINTDTIDVGMYGSYGNATTTEYTGFTRKASDKKWYLWANTTTEPNTSLANTTNLATLVINILETSTAIDPAYGGTGKTSFTGNAVVYTTNTTNMAFMAFGGDGTVLQMQGTTLAFAGLDGGAF